MKAEKIRPILGRIHTLKPNRIEAELLSGIPIREKADVEKAAQALLDTGLRRVFISLGSEGCYGATHNGSMWMPNFPVNMAVSAMNRNKLVGLYMNKIHTPRDTVFDETNIEFLCSGTIRMLDSVL